MIDVTQTPFSFDSIAQLVASAKTVNSIDLRVIFLCTKHVTFSKRHASPEHDENQTCDSSSTGDIDVKVEVTIQSEIYLRFCTFALVNYISVRPCNELLVDLACSVSTSEIPDLCFGADLNSRRSLQSVMKSIGPTFH